LTILFIAKYKKVFPPNLIDCQGRSILKLHNILQGRKGSVSLVPSFFNFVPSFLSLVVYGSVHFGFNASTTILYCRVLFFILDDEYLG